MVKRYIKKDTGIATLINGYRMPEETRDELASHDWNQPRNPAIAMSAIETTRDLEKKEFSGFRVNAWTGNIELWVLGKVASTRKCESFVKDPSLMATMHEEVFATIGTIIITDARPDGKVPRAH